MCKPGFRKLHKHPKVADPKVEINSREGPGWYTTVHATTLICSLNLPTTHLHSRLAEVLYHLRSKPQVHFLQMTPS